LALNLGVEGLRVLVTGASSGIGAACAAAFASCGARVVIHYSKNKAGASELAGQIGAVAIVAGDLMKRGNATKVVEEAAAALGGLDVLVNNAGAMVGRTRMAAFDDATYDGVMDLNVRSILEATRAAHPYLVKSGASASIVNIGSIGARNGGAPGSGLYVATKAAVHSLTRSMAKEFAPAGIRVNALAPGVIATPFHAATAPDMLEAARASIPMGRLGKGEDCAYPVVFLASPALAGYITGQILDVNGGQYMP
jgi:3-oxoacyl-[acyl-carrier protein] reductase